MPPADRFTDRFLADTYGRDEGVQLDYGDVSSAVVVPERLFGRAQCIARAYELRLLPTIDIYSKTRLNRGQCETLLDEIAFIGMVANDDLLREYLDRVRGVVAACIGVPQRELIIIRGAVDDDGSAHPGREASPGAHRR
jgi:hypothetical protein